MKNKTLILTLCVKMFKLLWNSFIYEKASEAVDKTDNTLDNKALEALDNFIESL